MLIMILLILLSGSYVWIYRLKALNKQLEIKQTEWISAHKEFKESIKIYQLIIQASPDAMLISDREGTIVMASEMACKMVGCKQDETLVGRNVAEFIVQKEHPLLEQNTEKLFANKVIGTTEYTGLRSNGEPFNMEVNSEVIQSEDGTFEEMVSIIRDVTKRKQVEKALRESEESFRNFSKELQIENQALNEISQIDSLTGIKNRRFFDQELLKEMQQAYQDGESLSIVLFDIDHFKEVNDCFGHDKGDQVIIRIVQEVNKYIRKEDVFARWGGEEFIILMKNIKLKQAKQMAERIRMVVEKINHLDVGKVTISMGISEYIWGEKIEALFKRADHALYAAKREGRNKVCINRAFSEKGLIHFEWQPSFMSGYPMIDEQHQVLIDLGNKLMTGSMNEEPTHLLLVELEALIEHVCNHFHDEEKLLEEIGYQQTVEHKKKHLELVNKAMQLKNRMKANQVHPYEALEFFMYEVVIGHLLKEDIKFFKH